MSSTRNPIPPHLLDLMVEHATQGLSPQDQAQLQSALAQDPQLQQEAEAFEIAATALELALDPAHANCEDLPPALREKLLASGLASLNATPIRPSLKLTEENNPPRTTTPASRLSLTDGRLFGWYAAIAALIALALLLLAPNTDTATNTPSFDQLAQQPTTLSANWAFNADGGDERFAKANGSVLWNPTSQVGYMKLSGLPVNDPAKEQYQLWIVDPSRDDEPIDGGVFDITAAGEVIIPIDAKLRSDSPAVFAITIEKPGGVVVSEGPLQVIAAVGKG